MFGASDHFRVDDECAPWIFESKCHVCSGFLDNLFDIPDQANFLEFFQSPAQGFPIGFVHLPVRNIPGNIIILTAIELQIIEHAEGAFADFIQTIKDVFLHDTIPTISVGYWPDGRELPLNSVSASFSNDNFRGRSVVGNFFCSFVNVHVITLLQRKLGSPLLAQLSSHAPFLGVRSRRLTPVFYLINQAGHLTSRQSCDAQQRDNHADDDDCAVSHWTFMLHHTILPR